MKGEIKMVKAIKKAVVFIAAAAALSSYAQAASIEVGEYVKLGSFSGEDIVWRCVSEDENGFLLLSDKILTLRAFDAAGRHSGDYKMLKQNYGNNNWDTSNLKCWLNSDADKGGVKWECGNPPTEQSVWNGYNAYDDDAGFLNLFSGSQKDAIKPVVQKQLLTYNEVYKENKKAEGKDVHISYSDPVENSLKNYDEAFYTTSEDKVFVLDMKQLYDVWKNSDILGERYYIGTITDKCYENTEYKFGIGKGAEWHTWLRTPYCTSERAMTMRHLWNNGWVERAHPYLSYIGVRPAFYFNVDAAFDGGNGSEQSPYVIK